MIAEVVSGTCYVVSQGHIVRVLYKRPELLSGQRLHLRQDLLSTRQCEITDDVCLLIARQFRDDVCSRFHREIYQQLDVVRRGRDLFFRLSDEEPIVAAFSYGTVLSLPYLFENLVPRVAEALRAGDSDTQTTQ